MYNRKPLSLKLFCQLSLILKKIKVWVLYLIPQKRRVWFNLVNVQYNAK